MKKSSKLAIIAAALLAVAPVATGLENVSGNTDTVFAAKKSKKKAKRAKKTSKKRTKRAKKSKKSKKSAKKSVKLLPFNDGSANYSFKGWKSLGENDAGYVAAYAFVKYPGKGNTPFVQFVLINPNTKKVGLISGAYDLKMILNAPSDQYFMLYGNGGYSDAQSLSVAQLAAVKKTIKANF